MKYTPHNIDSSTNFNNAKPICWACGESWDSDHACWAYGKPIATKETKEKCDHDHLCCPGDIKTVRCAYCGKSMYHEPQEELEVEELIIRDREKAETKMDNILLDMADKINQLIKVHNALVEEVKGK